MVKQSELEKVTINFPKALDFDGMKDLFTHLSKTVPNAYLRAGGKLLFKADESHRNLRDDSSLEFLRIQRKDPISAVTLNINYRMAAFSPTGEKGYIGMETGHISRTEVYNDNYELVENIRMATEDYFTKLE